LPTTRPKTTWAALCRPAILALALGVAPAPVLAQSQGWGAAPQAQAPAGQTFGDADILRLVDDGMIYLGSGDLETAYARFTLANDITFGDGDLGVLATHLPNLALARYNMVVENWPEMGRFAASVATALDVEEYRDHPYRIEAMAFQGVAAYVDNRMNEADLILRATLAATEGRPELAIARDLAHFTLAATAAQLSAPDATEIRRAYLDAPGVQDGYVTAAQIAFMYYAEMFYSRAEGVDPGELAADYAAFLDGATTALSLDPMEMSTYRGYLGLLQSEAGQHDNAVAAFEERHAFLLQNDLIDGEFMMNAERLAMTRHNMGETRRALDFLVETMAFAKARGLEAEVYAVFEQDMGIFQDALNEPELAQAHFRRAYAIMRETRAMTDRQVLVLRPLIDITDPGFVDFALADELRAAARPLTLARDGTTILTDFFQSGYLLLDDRLARAGQGLDADDPVLLLNRALFLALIGQQDAALADLAALGGDDPALGDLIELVARVWGADAAPAAAAEALARLEARFAILTPAQQSAYLALSVFQAFRLENMARARTLYERWRAVDDAQPDRGDPWHRFAAAMMIEAGMALLPPERADALWAQHERDTAILPPLPLLHDYARVMYLANAPEGLLTPGIVVELSGILRRMQDRLPRYHALISVTEFTLSREAQQRGRLEDALAWMDRTATTLRGHPFHSTDGLAFVLSEQSRLMMRMGRIDQAALMAREAYEMIDTRTGRASYVGVIVSNFTAALYARTQDSERAATILASNLDDPVYAARILPEMRAAQLIDYAGLVGEYGEWDEVRAAFDKAEAIFTRDDDFDRRGWLLRLNYMRAIEEYRFDIGDYGYARIRRANDLAAAMSREDTYNRATWTAAIGWDYAQTLND